MHRFRLNVRWIAVVLCVWPLGCMRPAEMARPGALPRAPLNHGPVRIQPTTYFAHGHLLEREGRFDEAVEQYQKALRLKPDFVAARNRLGITLNKLGRHHEATNEFLRAVELQPEEAYLHNNLGFSLYLEGNYSEALTALEKALQLTPDFARARMNYALVLAKLGRYDEAFTQLAQVGDEADACFNMGMLLSDAGKYAEAAKYLERAVELRPTFAAARIQLREVARIAAEQEARARRETTSTPPADATQDATIATATPQADDSDAQPAAPDAVAQVAGPAQPAHQFAAPQAGADVSAAADAHAKPDEPAVASSSDAPASAPSQPANGTVVAGVSFERGQAGSASASPHDPPAAGSKLDDRTTSATDEGAAGADPAAPDPNAPSDPALEQMLWELSQTPEVVGDLVDELLSYTSFDDPEAQDILCTLSYLLFPETAPEDFLGLPR